MLLPTLLLSLAAPLAQDPAPTRVFVLAGQSNMVGYTSAAWVEANAPALAQPRADVWVDWQLRCAPLAPGAGHEVGPELALGHALGDAFEEPVLLIKVAVGGTTLREDWRPPSTVAAEGGEIGYLYARMMKRVRRVLERPDLSCPAALGGGEFQLSGFVWLQGENDSFDGREQSYESNLRHLIADVRAATATPELPAVVIQINDSGAWDSSGGGGPLVRAAQAAVATEDPFAALVVTRDLDEGYHYADGDHVTIGQRAGAALLPLLERPLATDRAALAAAWQAQDALFYPGRGARPPRPEVHLSDLPWREASAGYGGDPRRDASIEDRPLAVDGRSYAKGIGTHAESELVIGLDESYTRFVSVAGIDDEMGERDVCSAVFQVWFDDELAAESVVVKAQEEWFFDLPVPAGARAMRLRVLEADSGNNSDHADWVDCGFLRR